MRGWNKDGAEFWGLDFPRRKLVVTCRLSPLKCGPPKANVSTIRHAKIVGANRTDNRTN
jgi:hypothetical protein